MNDLFDPESADRLLARIQALQPQQPALWGRMNVAQMLRHCQAPFAVYFGELKLRQSLVGRLFGPFARRRLFSGKPWPRGLPTAAEFVVINECDFESERHKLVEKIERFAGSSILLHPPRHPFFGKMSAQDWSRLAWKHTDHHLRQFGS